MGKETSNTMIRNGDRLSSPSIEESDRCYLRAVNLIPGVTQTLAKGPGQYVKGVAPKYLQRGQGSHVWDVDGNEYIDYSMAVGPLILGYAYPAVDEAVRRQLSDGITFSLMHPLEVELAELLHELIPCAEMVRFGKNGADVTSAAVRLARAYTGRDRVVCCGYHGWHDWYISVTDRARGIPNAVRELTSTFDYNDDSSLESVLDETVACVIMEPVTVESPKPGFLNRVRELTHQNGSLLVFDEIWTGFRFSLHGAQRMFNVIPDLATFSKAMSNGMPISALVGRKEIMQLLDREVFFFLTFGGEALSLAASVATIRELRRTNALDQIWRQGEKLKVGYNRLAEEAGISKLTTCVGYPCRTIVTFDGSSGSDPLEMKSLVQQELIRRGILWSGFHTVSYSHTDEDVDRTLQAYSEVLPLLGKAVGSRSVRSYLRGEPVEPIFRRVSNFNTKPKRSKGKRS